MTFAVIKSFEEIKRLSGRKVTHHGSNSWMRLSKRITANSLEMNPHTHARKRMVRDSRERHPAGWDNPPFPPPPPAELERLIPGGEPPVPAEHLRWSSVIFCQDDSLFITYYSQVCPVNRFDRRIFTSSSSPSSRRQAARIGYKTRVQLVVSNSRTNHLKRFIVMIQLNRLASVYSKFEPPKPPFCTCLGGV